MCEVEGQDEMTCSYRKIHIYGVMRGRLAENEGIKIAKRVRARANHVTIDGAVDVPRSYLIQVHRNLFPRRESKHRTIVISNNA